jgi:hypothetical protein
VTVGRALAAAAVLAVPAPAWACATCLSTAFGDRTFNWAYVGLLLMPFVVAAVVGAILFVRYRAPKETT